MAVDGKPLASNKKGSRAFGNEDHASRVEKLRQKKEAKKAPIKHTKVFVGNLPDTVTEEICSIFSFLSYYLLFYLTYNYFAS